MNDTHLECMCLGCGLIHLFSRDEVVLEPVDGDPQTSVVANGCCSTCGEALVTDAAAETDEPQAFYG